MVQFVCFLLSHGRLFASSISMSHRPGPLVPLAGPHDHDNDCHRDSQGPITAHTAGSA